MALIDELKEKREVWRINVSLHDQRALNEVSFALAAQAMVDDLDTAIAALEPAPETQAPTSSPSTDEGRSVPGAEEEVRDQIDEPSEFISDLTGDPAIEPETGLHADPEPTELDAEPEYTEADLLEGLSHVASITEDPELQAAVARAEATLAQEEPAYVGLQDPDLDAEYEAMREREKADRKLHFSIFGMKREDA